MPTHEFIAHTAELALRISAPTAEGLYAEACRALGRLLIDEAGEQGTAGPGDLYLIVRVIPHETFKRDGNNLTVKVPVDVTTAVLGGKVTVPTLDGPVKLTIPSSTQGGRTFRLKGRGMPDLRQKGVFGDLLAKVRIKVPEHLGDEERRLYEELARVSGTER